VRTVGEGGDHATLEAVVEPPSQLRNRVGDPGGGNDRLADEPSLALRAELGEPFVVGTHADELQLAVVGVRARAGERDARIDDLGVDAVRIEVGEARRRIEAAGTDVLVAEPLRAELDVAQTSGGGEAERTQALAVVERPDVALRRAEDFWCPCFQVRRHARLPEIGRLVHVRVGVEDRIVDAGDLGEELGHLPDHPFSGPAGVKNGATMARSTPATRSGRKFARTGMSIRSAAASQSTRRVVRRTAGSSSMVTSPVTYGTSAANCGMKARRTTAQEKSRPRPLTTVQVCRSAPQR